jgi:hypothetical protein
VSEASSVLLLHEAGELEDVAALLRSLGIPFGAALRALQRCPGIC